MSNVSIRTRLLAGCAALCAAAFVSVAQAQAPAAPDVTYWSATKQMKFSWPIVPRSGYYELWFKANDGSAPVKFGELQPWIHHWYNGVSAHLLNWSQARWEVRACNPSGCSSSGLIDTGSTVVDTVGFVKAKRVLAEGHFGAAVTVSEDGKTLGVIAADEPVADGMAAAAYFFRSVSGRWQEISRFVVGTHPRAGDAEGATISLRNDGEVVLIGLPTERLGGGDAERGVVHLRHRLADGTWAKDQVFGNSLGTHVGAFSEINEAGNLLVYSDEAMGGAVQVWTPHDGHWEFARSVASGKAGPCAFDLSGDGARLARRCDGDGHVNVYSTSTGLVTAEIGANAQPGYELSGLSIDADGSTVAVGTAPHDVNAADYVAANWRPTVQIFRRNPADVFERVATFEPNVHQSTEYAKRSYFGQTLVLSHDGGYAAVADPHDSLARSGVWPPDEIGEGGSSEAAAAGAVYLFERYSRGYRLRRHVGPYVQDRTLEAAIGAVALGNNGKTLAIAEPLDDNSHTGVGPYLLSQTPIGGSGAVWLY